MYDMPCLMYVIPSLICCMPYFIDLCQFFNMLNDKFNVFGIIIRFGCAKILACLCLNPFKLFQFQYRLHVNVIYRFSSISWSTRANFKFEKKRSLLEIGQNILIVHPFDKWCWGFVLMGECLGLNLFSQQWESWLQFCVVQ